jgi:hypothetical protein
VYVGVLARAAAARRGPDYWQFHREALATLGQSLPVGGMAWWIAAYALDKVLNPGRTARSLLERLGRGRPASPRES